MPGSDLHLKGDTLAAVCRIDYGKAEVEVGRQFRSCYRDSGRDEGGLDQNSTHRVGRSDQIPKCTLHFDI